MGKIKEMLLSMGRQDLIAVLNTEIKEPDICKHKNIEEIEHDPEHNIEGVKICEDCEEVLQYFRDIEPPCEPEE